MCMRRRKLAWIFALVLLMELAVLCCACIQASDHICATERRCPICDYIRSCLHDIFTLSPIILALGILVAVRTPSRPASGWPVLFDTLITRKVQFND